MFRGGGVFGLGEHDVEEVGVADYAGGGDGVFGGGVAAGYYGTVGEEHCGG